MKHFFPVLIMLLIVSFQSLSQWTVGFTVDVTKPLYDFEQNVSQNAVGLSFNGLYRIGESRLQVGGELGVAMYSNKSYDYELVSEGQPGTFIEVDEEDCFLSYRLLGRYDLYRTNTITTFLEANAGFMSFFSTRMATEVTEFYEDETTFHGTAFNTGLGGGISVDIVRLFTKESPTVPVYLDARMIYNAGTYTNYRNIQDESVTGVGLNYGKFKSATDNLACKIGLSVSI